MAKYIVVYRGGEFEAEIEAKNVEEAIRKFKSGDCEIKRAHAELWDEYIKVYTEENGNGKRRYAYF